MDKREKKISTWGVQGRSAADLSKTRLSFFFLSILKYNILSFYLKKKKKSELFIEEKVNQM